MIGYILQVVLFQLLFLLVYEVLLKKETFFTWNRWYLLATSVVSLLLPFIEIDMLSVWFARENVSNIEVTWFSEEITEGIAAPGNRASIPATAPGLTLNWWIIAYAAGVAASLHLLLKKWKGLSRLFRFRAISSEKDLRIIEVPNSKIACTFYKTVFLGDKLAEAERQQILIHELVHVKQKHSLDLLFFEIYKVFFWFNPLIYIYQSRIATLHEYIADAVVVKNTEKRSYYEHLLNSAFGINNISFINQFFNHSLVKKRIIMIQKSKSKTTAKIKYLALLPLTLLMLSFVAYSGTGNNPIAEIADEGITNETDATAVDPVMETYPFAIVEEVPIFPGCENVTDKKSCMAENIKTFVATNISREAVSLYTQPEGANVTVVFRIDESGRVTEVKARATSPKLDAGDKAILEREAIKVVNALPQAQPGKHEGKVVGVAYAIRL